MPGRGMGVADGVTAVASSNSERPARRFARVVVAAVKGGCVAWLAYEAGVNVSGPLKPDAGMAPTCWTG